MSLMSVVFAKLFEFLLAAKIELSLFGVAVAAYFFLFGNVLPKNSKLADSSSSQKDETDESLDDRRTQAKSLACNPEDYESIEKAFQTAFEEGDHRSVLRCWNAMKKFDRPPSVSVACVVESMQRFKKDTPFIIRELKAFFKKYPQEREMGFLNDLLESLARRLDSDLMERILEMLPQLDLQPDQRTYEIFLSMHFQTRSFAEVRALASDMRRKKVPFTTRASLVMIKTALKTGAFDEALVHFRQLRSSWDSSAASLASPSLAPRHIVAQLIELACKEHMLGTFLDELKGIPVLAEVADVMLAECMRQKDTALAKRVEVLCREQKVEFSSASYGYLIRCYSSEPKRVQQIFEEVIERKLEMSADLAQAVLAFCSQTGNVPMADSLYQAMKPKQIPVLSSFIRFYAEQEQFDKACDIYEKDLQNKEDAKDSSSMGRTFLDAGLERTLMNAAFSCGRSTLAKGFLDSAPSDIAKHITMIRNCAAERNLKGAMSVFESLQHSAVELNNVVYNTVLDACVECCDLEKATEWMKKMKEVKMADVVSYNTLIKFHLQRGQFDKARGLMEEMKSEGLQPNRVTFNELLNAMIGRTDKDGGVRSQIWEVITEMQAAEVKPNQVTCSILLKSLGDSSNQSDILKTMELINTMEEPMDEVLLSSVVEACVRIGKPDLLTAKLKQLQGDDTIALTGSHTFGSLIKAYGHAKDIDGVWRCWKEMRSRHIRPTSITLGCMVEAVVCNGDTEGAYDLIHQMHDDEHCRNSLNAVIYCSVLKGFAREQKLDRVWSVFNEMQKRQVELSIVTFNTIIDACTRCGRMDQVPGIVKEMRDSGIDPNVITYSTMLKGHCHAGDIQNAFMVLEDMKKNTKLKPDEIMYNSLLDGCALNNLVQEGMKLLSQMENEGVKPSNFTLSILVKMMNRSRKLDEAFNIVTRITEQYRFKPNVHVYTNLIQACVSNRQLQRGVETLNQMVKERIQPDNRTYTVLVRGCVAANSLEQACGILRAGLGLPDPLPQFQGPQAQSITYCSQLNYSLVSELLVSLAERGQAQSLALPMLEDLRKYRPHVRVESSVQGHIMACAAAGDDISNLPPAPQLHGSYGGGYNQRSGGGGGKGKGGSKGGPRGRR
jgi:pentatricopeptide repeat protein